MYSITNEEVVRAATGTSRTFRALLEFSDGGIISGADVGAITAEHIMSDDDTIAIGRIISRRAEISIYGGRTVRRGSSFRLYLYILDWGGVSSQQTTHRMLSQWTHRELSMLTHARIARVGKSKDPDGAALGDFYIPLGEFVAVKCVSSGSSAVITAYDRLYFSENPYAPGIEFPADAADVTDDILSQLGIAGRVTADSGELLCTDLGVLLTSEDEEIHCGEEYSFTITSAPEGRTCREVLGHIAAMYGRNGVLNRNGEYTTVFISPCGEPFGADTTDEPELADNDVSVSGIRCVKNAETTLTAGDPEGAYAVGFECPYMTESRLGEIWGELLTLSWRPAQVYERIADPRRDIGDMMYISASGVRCNIPVTSLTFHFDGGLAADISACGQVESSDFSATYTESEV